MRAISPPFLHLRARDRKPREAGKGVAQRGMPTKGRALEEHYQDGHDSDTFTNDQVLAGGAGDKEM